MKTTSLKFKLLGLLALGALNFQLSTAFAQGTAFTYQGRLNSGGAAASGSYDMAFSLFATNASGVAIAGPVTNAAVPVTNGLFTTTVDFGNVFPGGSNWLQIAVSTNGANAFSPLLPRQQLTPVPYAIVAGTVSGTIASASLAGTYGNAVTLNNANNSFAGSFTGNGASVSNVNAKALNGLNATNFWQTGGNNVAAGQFLGSTNGQPVAMFVNAQRALLILTNPADSANIVGGSPANVIDAGVKGAVIAGGGTTNFLGQSSSNEVSADFSSIGGGSGNWIQTGSDHSFIGSGWNNLVGTYQSVVAGGQNNSIQSGQQGWSVIGGGIGNDINRAGGSFIGGGQNNTNSGTLATLGGGYGNLVTNSYATLGGGDQNFVGGQYATLGGGFQNSAGGYVATVGGGANNTNNVTFGTIAGGQNNLAAGSYATVSGGYGNLVTNSYATLSGGDQNFVGGQYATLGGGYQNSAGGLVATVGGGANNTNSSANGTIAGGNGNTASGQYDSTVSGGSVNTASGNYATVSGGIVNTASGITAVVGGGDSNTASNHIATVGGGVQNTAGGYAATVPGGSQNLAGGAYSFAAGDQAQATNSGSFVWADAEGTPFGSTIANQFNVRADGGVRFVTADAGMTVDGQPVFAGVNGNGLTNLNAAQLFFGVISNGVLPNFQASDGYAAIGGGQGNIVMSPWATIGGGLNNSIQNLDIGYATIAGGIGNSISEGDYAFIGGGQNNYDTIAYYGVIGGGQNNQLFYGADHAVIGGGQGNQIYSSYGAIGGGGNNLVTNFFATVPGGANNLASGQYSFAAGDQAQATNDGAFVWADAEGTPFASTTTNQFNVRANGGVRFVTPGFTVNGSQSGGFGTPLALMQNNNTSGSTAPTLRTVGHGNSPNGVLSVSSQGTGLIAQFGNANTFVADLTTNGTFDGAGFNGGTLRIGSSGTTITTLEAGQAVMPPSSLQETNFTIFFPTAFTTVPKVIASISFGLQGVNDIYAINVSSNSTTAFRVNVMRLDTAGGWGQDLLINWQAWQ